MYRNCIFCSADLGSNDVLESFPVGRRVAFDSVRGRLWAVCLMCGRWNLAPMEERWEAVESAERLFRDARMKVQRERVGLARLADDTSLVRVGEAVPGEMAAWRYGSRLLARRRRAMWLVAGSGVFSAAYVGGMWISSGAALGLQWAQIAWEKRQRQRVLYRVSPSDDPTGQGAVIRSWHVDQMRLFEDEPGVLGVTIQYAWRKKAPWGEVDYINDREILHLKGEPARALLTRSMVRYNHKGATKQQLQQALQLLEQAGDAERVVHDAAQRGLALGVFGRRRLERLKGPESLAVEMALNEQAEREALEGELAGLERAWREAEEIAAIADMLPGEETLNRMLARLAARRNTL